MNRTKSTLWKRPLFIVGMVSILGAIWRLYLFSGDGLGDDASFFFYYYRMFFSGEWKPFAYNYRLGSCLPILLTWKLLGVSELTWIVPNTVASVACIPLTYLLGQRLYSKRAGLIAAVLLAVHPFDVLTSTLFVNDVPFSLYVTLAVLFFLTGLRRERGHRQLWFVLSSFFLFWSYMTKMWGIFTIPVFGLISIINWRQWKCMLIFYNSLLIFFSASFLVDWVLTGDPFGYYHAESEWAGLYRVTFSTLLEYPRQMFLPNQYGHLFHGLYFWLAIPALVLAGFRWSKTHVPVIWLIVMFLTLEFLPQKVTLDGWYSQARIFRYLSVLVVPVCLVLAFGADELIRRWHKAGWWALIVFICVSMIGGYRLTWPSRDAFDDIRTGAREVVDLPRKPIHSDYAMIFHIEKFHFQYKKPHLIRYIQSEEPMGRKLEFLKISNAYVITGGARLPYYGCNHCVANIGNFDIPDNWKLVWIMDKPSEQWRKEPLRIWNVGFSHDLEKEISKYEDLQDLYDAALRYFFKKEYAEARVMLERVVQKPHSWTKPYAWYYYGISFLRQGYFDEALTEFKDLLASYPGHKLEADVHYHIGVTYETTGNIEEAINVLEYVVCEFPQSLAAGYSQDLLNRIRDQRKRSTE